MEKVVQELQNEAIRGKVNAKIGGAPVRVDFTHRIGADAHGKYAVEAVTNGLFIKYFAADKVCVETSKPVLGEDFFLWRKRLEASWNHP